MNAFGEIGVFVRVVDKRSFTRAGASLGLTPSGVSRVMTRLESRLGVRLLERTTRTLGLTAEGTAYYERCTNILRELEDAEGTLSSSRGTLRGRIRVDVPTVLGRFVIGPAIAQFLDAYPELSIDLSTRDYLIDPIAEGVDVVLRMADLRESELIRKHLGTIRFSVVGSPRYLARHGRPETPADLKHHQTLGFLLGSTPMPWRFQSQGREVVVSPSGRLSSNSVDALRQAALTGHGLVQLFEFHVRDDIARKRLEAVLPHHERRKVPIHALYTRDKASLPKVRAFLDFMETCLDRDGLGIERPGRKPSPKKAW